MSANDLGYVGALSQLVGTSEPALRLLLSILIGYPLALVYRQLISNKSIIVKHLFIIASGLLLCLFNYGYEVYHSLIAVIGSFILIKMFIGTSLLVVASFLFHMGYLLIGYYYTGTETYDIKWTMPHCVLVLRLIGLAFDISDGQEDEKKLSAENKKTALKDPPNLLEVASYTFFPASFLVGPQFPCRRFHQFINGDFEKYKGNVVAGFKRGGVGLLYLAMNQVGSMYFSESLLLSDEFAQRSFFYKIFVLGLWGKFSLYKYISCWLLSEGVATCFGLTFVKVNEDGSEDWSGCANIKLWIFENASNLGHYILSFNVNTNHWVAQYIFKRLKFLGNRNLSHVSTLMFLAVWHGFHSGYYMCFFMEFIMVFMEKDIEYMVAKNEKFTAFLEQPIVKPILFVFLKAYTICGMGWALTPFVFLSYKKWWAIFVSVNYYGFIVYVPWTFLYKPLFKKFLKQFFPVSTPPPPGDNEKLKAN